MISKYSQKTKMITKSIQIVLSGNEDNYIEDEAQVKSYLEKYGITAKDLDSYYDEIVNQKVLKDWCSIYDSKYSPSNYGDVKIETQWENWWQVTQTLPISPSLWRLILILIKFS